MSRTGTDHPGNLTRQNCTEENVKNPFQSLCLSSRTCKVIIFKMSFSTDWALCVEVSSTQAASLLNSASPLLNDEPTWPRVSLIIKLWVEDKMFENSVMFHKVIIMFMMIWPPPQWWLIHEILWVNYGLARDKLLQLIQYQNTGISLIYLNTERCYTCTEISVNLA